MKNIFTWMLYGAAATAGSMLVHKVVDIANDPVRKTELKKGFKNIKNSFSVKIES